MGRSGSDNVWRFGDAEFDEDGGRLSVAGRAVEIDRNCAAILSVLLAEAGREVAKERLLESGWPDRIVHENSLAKAIGRLRVALGQQGSALETVYGIGYKLAIEARRVEAGPPEVAAEPSSPAIATADATPAASPERRWRSPTLLAAAVLALTAGLGAAAWLNSAKADAEAEFRTTPPVIGDAPDAVGRLLWVDDNPQNNIYEERFFEDHRIAVHAVTGSTDAMRLLAMYDYTVVISDMGRGEDRLAGIRLVERMRAEKDQTPVLIYTVRPDGEAAQQAQRHLVAEAGAQGVVVTPEEVRSVILKMFGNPSRRPAS